MPTFLTPGSEFQVNMNSGGNNGINGAQDLPDIALLPDGRFAVAYQSDYFGSATDTDPIFAIFNATGTASLAYRDAFNAGGHQKVAAVAERLNGGFGLIFQNDRHANGSVDSNGPNITYVPVSAAGGALVADRCRRFQLGIGARLPAERGDRHAFERAAGRRVRARLDGGCRSRRLPQRGECGRNRDAVQHRQSAGRPSQRELAGEPGGRRDRQPALVVFEDGTGTTTSSANIRGRFFDGTSNTLGAAFTIADHTARLRTADVAAIDDYRYAITYGDQNDVWVKVLDSTTGILSAGIQLDVTGGFSLNPQVHGAPGAGFVVTWAQWNGADYDVRARLFDGHANAVGSDFIVTSLTDDSQFTPTVAASDHHIFFAWTDFAARPTDTAAPGIRGRSFGVA